MLNTEDLGRTNVIQHRIHSGEATPIKLPPRLLPIISSEKGSPGDVIENMCWDGVIEESHSPWSSPLFC